MEADWEIEIGSDAPVIDACWSGLVDLHLAPGLAAHLPESATLPGLSEALVRLNASQSPVWTAKCDVWALTDLESLDPDEMSATPETAVHAWACYIDLLPKSDQSWIVAAMAVNFCKVICQRVHTAPLTCCRADLVVRRAVIAPSLDRIGVTAYLIACGTTSQDANQTLQNALGAFVDAICARSTLE